MLHIQQSHDGPNNELWYREYRYRSHKIYVPGPNSPGTCRMFLVTGYNRPWPISREDAAKRLNTWRKATPKRNRVVLR